MGEQLNPPTGPAMPSIRYAADAPEFDTAERCAISEWSNCEQDPTVSIAHARVRPGVTTCWHCVRDTAERYVIMQGEGRVEVGDLPPQTVGPGDVVLIPAGCRQRIANVGTIDLCFLAICTPRFQAANYCDLEAS